MKASPRGVYPSMAARSCSEDASFNFLSTDNPLSVRKMKAYRHYPMRTHALSIMSMDCALKVRWEASFPNVVSYIAKRDNNLPVSLGLF